MGWRTDVLEPKRGKILKVEGAEVVVWVGKECSVELGLESQLDSWYSGRLGGLKDMLSVLYDSITDEHHFKYLHVYRSWQAAQGLTITIPPLRINCHGLCVCLTVDLALVNPIHIQGRGRMRLQFCIVTAGLFWFAAVFSRSVYFVWWWFHRLIAFITGWSCDLPPPKSNDVWAMCLFLHTETDARKY